MTPVQDWYALLGVTPAASAEEIAIAVEKLGRQANALSVTMPQRARLLRDQIRAIRQDLLSGDAQRRRYDQGLAGPPSPAWPAGAQAAQAPWQGPGPAPVPGQGQGQGPGQPGWAGPNRQQPWAAPQPAPQPAPQLAALVGRVARFLQAGWTCTACGYDALPNDKFCHKCGAKIEAPARPAARPGPGQPGTGQPGTGQPGTGQPAAGQPGAARLGAGQPVPGQLAPAQAVPGQPTPGQAGLSAFCGKCGGQIAAGNTFCTQCGAQRA